MVNEKISTNEMDNKNINVYAKKYYPGIDIIKLVMSLIVVAIHTGALESVRGGSIVYNVFFTIAVPYFFMSSGFLLGLSLEEPFSTQKNAEMLRQFFLRMLRLYLVWTLIYFPLAIKGYYLGGTTIVKAVKSYILYLLFVGEHYNSWPLWYLLSSIWTAAFLLIMHYSKKISFLKLVQYGILISIVSFSLNLLVNVDSDTLLFAEKLIKDVVCSSIKNGRIMMGAVYIPFGLYISKNRGDIKRNYLILLLLGITLGMCWDNQFLRGYSTMFSAVGLFGWSTHLNIKCSNITKHMRKMSTWIYFIHMYVYTGIYLALYGKKTSGPLLFLLTVILSVCISIILDKVIKGKWKKLLV